MTTTDFLTAGEAASILRTYRAAIYALIHRGTLPAVRVGRQWRVRRVDVERLPQTQEVAAVSLRVVQ